uniref:Uncharacterized protein n=1 Tax=Solanum lycopersicum TaxID=4081 RepID=A0A3Q7IW57_SOLLC
MEQDLLREIYNLTLFIEKGQTQSHSLRLKTLTPMPNQDNKKGKALRKEESLQMFQNEYMKALLATVHNNIKQPTC